MLVVLLLLGCVVGVASAVEVTLNTTSVKVSSTPVTADASVSLVLDLTNLNASDDVVLVASTGDLFSMKDIRVAVETIGYTGKVTFGGLTEKAFTSTGTIYTSPVNASITAPLSIKAVLTPTSKNVEGSVKITVSGNATADHAAVESLNVGVGVTALNEDANLVVTGGIASGSYTLKAIPKVTPVIPEDPKQQAPVTVNTGAGAGTTDVSVSIGQESVNAIPTAQIPAGVTVAPFNVGTGFKIATVNVNVLPVRPAAIPNPALVLSIDTNATALSNEYYTFTFTYAGTVLNIQHYDGNNWNDVKFMSAGNNLWRVYTKSFSPFAVEAAAPAPVVDNGGADNGLELLAAAQATPTANVTATPTVEVTVVPTTNVTGDATAVPTDVPSTPTASVTGGQGTGTPTPTTAPAPILGILAGLGVAAVILRRN